jgi:hypothetical protein
MTITRGRGLVLTVCNNSEVPTFTKDFQTADELGIYRNRSLIKLQGTESEASKPTYKDQWKRQQNNKFKKKKKKTLRTQQCWCSQSLSSCSSSSVIPSNDLKRRRARPTEVVDQDCNFFIYLQFSYVLYTTYSCRVTHNGGSRFDASKKANFKE